MGKRQADERIRRDHTGTAIKRRGLLAGAAALVAGIAAQRTSQPVAAGSDHQALVIAESNSASSGGTVLQWTGGRIASGAALTVYDGGAAQTFTAMLAGIATGVKADSGVYGEGGTGVQGHGTGTGVSGTAPGFGVYGLSSGTNGTGVYGFGNTGVEGSGNTKGVYGHSANGHGVEGASQSGDGA
jgi:hypothetical protein